MEKDRERLVFMTTRQILATRVAIDHEIDLFNQRWKEAKANNREGEVKVYEDAMLILHGVNETLIDTLERVLTK